MPEINFPATPTQREFIACKDNMIFLMGPRGEGKLCRPASLVLTPTGWVKAGDISVGDELISCDGMPTRVRGVYPQPVQPLWRLRFSDGTSFTTSDDHLWAVETKWDRDGGPSTDQRDRRGITLPNLGRGEGAGRGGRARKQRFTRPNRWRGQKVVSTHEIREKLEGGAWKSGGRWSIPLVSPVQFAEQGIPLDPYLLGVLLGDGSIGEKSISLTSADAAIVDAVRAMCSPGSELIKAARYGWRIRGTAIREALRPLGLLGHRAWEKFIPACYLWNVPDVRIAILQGLLDTDGTILSHSNSVSFATTSEQLALDVVFLVQSLGGIAPMRTRQTHYPYKGEKKTGRLSYHVNICLPNGIAPFRLQRKLERVLDKGERNRPRRFIVGVEPAEADGGVCFEVEHPSHLYVVHDFIVTHNTTTGLFATIAHALEQPPAQWPIRWAVIRDTWENLRITTIESIRRACREYGLPNEGLDRLEPKVVKIGLRTTLGFFRPIVELNFFGLDTPDDANRLQGFEGAGAWIEEPAPAADISSGIPEDALLAVTSLRQGGAAGVRPRVQVTMNPPDKDHWTIKYRDDLDTIERLRSHGYTVKFLEIPKGENPGITDEYRRHNKAILEAMGRFDLIARLVEGKVGYIQLGVAVTPEFGEVHIAKIELPILRSVPVQRSWDFGLNPTTVWWQITPIGRINVFMSIRGANLGMQQHIEQNVLPWQGRKGINDYTFEDIGDPNGLTPEARNNEVSAVTAIEEMLTSRPKKPASFEGGPIPIPDRVGPIRAKLEKTLKGGQPTVQVDPEAIAMIRALSGGWHYKKSPSGIIGNIVKDEASEHGDAWGYGMGVHFPIPKFVERPKGPKYASSRPLAESGRAWMTG